jgi:hypothetical protein
MPKTAIHRSTSAWATTEAVCSRRGTAMDILENLSVMHKTNRFPRGVVRRGPSTSMAANSNGRMGGKIVSGIDRLGPSLSHLDTHAGQLCTTAAQSRAIEGQNY